MKPCIIRIFVLLLFALVFHAQGCSKKTTESSTSATPHKHEHKPPHGGTPVVLGDEVYHIELVRDVGSGTLQAYIFDGELENFIRSSVPSFEVACSVNEHPQNLIFKAVANPATGETVGDTSLFEAQADWLKTTANFDAELKAITVRGTAFREVKFNFPKGNDKD